jgi:hypothetical protein
MIGLEHLVYLRKIGDNPFGVYRAMMDVEMHSDNSENHVHSGSIPPTHF